MTENNSMTEHFSTDQIFIQKLTERVLANPENKNIGVKELSQKSGTSQYRILKS
jgi:hypothetical protein